MPPHFTLATCGLPYDRQPSLHLMHKPAAADHAQHSCESLTILLWPVGLGRRWRFICLNCPLFASFLSSARLLPYGPASGSTVNHYFITLTSLTTTTMPKEPDFVFENEGGRPSVERGNKVSKYNKEIPPKLCSV